MRPLRSFTRGGLSLRLQREWPLELPVRNAFLPVSAVVLLKQHAGSASRCLVSKGEFVREGMLIGKAESIDQSAVHSPIPGIVREIRRIRLPTGGESEAVVIALEGFFDRLGKKQEKFLWSSMARNDVLQTLRDKGVVETDPPGAPLAEVLFRAKGVKLLILNCIESEPWIRTETAALEARAAEVLDGLRIISASTEPGKVIIALDESEPALAKKIENLIALEEKSFECVRLKSRYPQDLPSRLLEAFSPRHQVGQKADSALFVRPSTAIAAYDAIALSKPFIERYVTVGGGVVKRPAVLKVRIGTSIGDLFEECGGFLGNPDRIILGGPFRGLPSYDLDMPVSKTTNAILALSAEETKRGNTVPCIRCGRCKDVCPEGIDPNAIYRRIDRSLIGAAFEFGLRECSICGLCGYVCPSRLPLVERFAAYKSMAETSR